jgi:hypothetical protein
MSSFAGNLTVLELSRLALSRHPLVRLGSIDTTLNSPIEDNLYFMSQQEGCKGLPIFVSMSNVFSDLYWQLIENFIYTMVKFELSACSALICVSDKKCIDLCKSSGFPCLNFEYMHFHPNAVKVPHVMEQIAELKLLHLPKVLSKGVDLLMLDLDAAFTSSPLRLVEALNHFKKVDIFVQRDISFVMNRTR